MPNFLIGSKLVSILLTFFISSCGLTGVYDEYNYFGIIKNDTNTELLLLRGTDTSSFYKPESITLPPNSEIELGSVTLYNNDNPIYEFLNGGYRAYEEQTRIYRQDTLLSQWDGPPRELPTDSIHYYNYNSWEVIKSDDFSGKIIFRVNEDTFIH